MKTNTFAEIIADIGEALTELIKVLATEDEFISHLFKNGYTATNFPAQYQSLLPIVSGIRINIINFDIENASIDDINDLIDSIRGLYDLIKTITQIPTGITNSNFLNEIPQIFFTKVLYDYFQSHKSGVFNLLYSLGIIENVYVLEPDEDNSYYKTVLNTDRLKEYISHPNDAFKSVLNWGTNEFASSMAFNYLKRCLNGINIPAVIVKNRLGNVFQGLNGASHSYLKIPLILFYQSDIPIEIGIELHSVHDENTGMPGIAILPYFPVSFSDTIQISDSIKFSWKSDSNLEKLFGILILPETGIQLSYPNSVNISELIANLEFVFSYSPQDPFILFGKSDETRLQLGGIDLQFGVEMYGEKLNFIFNFFFKNFEVVIQSSEADNFLNKVISGEKRIPFELSLMWSSESGLHFTGSGGFEIELKPHLQLGPISVNDAKIRLYATAGEPGGVKFEGSASILADIGPVALSIKDVGISFNIGFDEGNVGPFDIQIGFKPPTGVGLDIDAPPVSGSGFLNYNEATYTYTGGLELNFSKISFSAIGIISTKLPGGDDGYSLLIIITAEFGPLPIGLGFTLNGLGGLMGLNRTMDPEFLREGIKNNTLDSILFPHDIARNANTIISNIGQAFPILKDQFVIGPMAKIGWGTPTLITIELGIMIELPNPVRLAILGVLKAILPKESKRVLQLQVNFLGIIDFDNKYISFDASLYDSKILTFALLGDMALRLYWGDEPNFLLAVGGFHPKFTPPPLDLPALRRLTIVLANEKDLKISVETYFAVTSNSVQFGAKVAAMAKAWKIQAIGALWFDILFQFSPFHFIADMGAMFAIKTGTKTILSIFIDLSLEGPHPWKVQGRGSFKIVFVKVNVSFNKTFGTANVETIPPVAIDDKFTDALKSKDNWEAVLPDRNNQQVATKEISPGQVNNLIVDPGGSLRFSQNLLPLDTKMEKFGNTAISDYNKYSISAINQSFTLTPAQDYFARNSFFYLSDDDKLSRPSYELFNSGFIAGATDIKSKYVVHRQCTYEHITIDSGYRKKFVVPWELIAGAFDVMVFENYVSSKRVAEFDKVPTEKVWPGTVQLEHEDDAFVLVNRNNLEQAVPQSFSSSVEAERMLREQRDSQPAVASEWIVANRFELEL